MAPLTPEAYDGNDPEFQAFIGAVAPYANMTSEIYGEDAAEDVVGRLAEAWAVDPRVVHVLSATFASHVEEAPLIAYVEATGIAWGEEAAHAVAEFFQEQLAEGEDDLSAEADALAEVQDQLEPLTPHLDEVDARRSLTVSEQLVRYANANGIELDPARFQQFVQEAVMQANVEEGRADIDAINVTALTNYLKVYYPDIELPQLLGEDGFLRDGEGAKALGKAADPLDQALHEVFNPRLASARTEAAKHAEEAKAAMQASAGADIFDELAAELAQDGERSTTTRVHEQPPQEGVYPTGAEDEDGIYRATVT